jgi:Zn-dependent peptidase ImmA (M78 family)
MPATLINVSPLIWQWVLSEVNVDGKNKEQLEEWISGKKLPTISQLEKFSGKTHIPLGYFFLKTPPDEQCKLTEFRTLHSAPLKKLSRELFETTLQMEGIQEWMQDHLIRTGAGKNRFTGSINPKQTVFESAKIVRDFLRLEIDWFKTRKSADGSFRHLRNAISSAGILVMKSGIVGNNTRRKLDINEFRAFSLIDDYAPLIFINAKDSPEGKVFSIIHELIHVGVGRNGIFNSSQNDYPVHGNSIETFCNGVTAELLMPFGLFREKWHESREHTLAKIAALSRYFKCSQLAIARRALDSGFLKQEEYALVSYRSNTAIPKRSDIRVKFADRKVSSLDHHFLLALYSSVKEGKTLYTDAYWLTGTKISSFEEVIMKVQGKQK